MYFNLSPRDKARKYLQSENEAEGSMKDINTRSFKIVNDSDYRGRLKKRDFYIIYYKAVAWAFDHLYIIRVILDMYLP